MLVRILLAALMVGLGVHHVAPLMPVADGTVAGQHAAHIPHEASCAGACPGDQHDGMGMALVCIGMLAIAASLPRVRQRLGQAAGRVAGPSGLRHRAIAMGAVADRAPPWHAVRPRGVAVLRC